MPIVSSTYRLGPEQPNGSVMVYEQHKDHVGVPHGRNQRRPAVADHDAELLAYKNDLETTLLAKRERLVFIRFLEGGGLPDDFLRNHNTGAEFIKPLLGVFGRSKDAHFCLPLAVWIQANLTAGQIEAATNTNIKNKVISRATRLLTMQVDLQADYADLVEVR